MNSDSSQNTIKRFLFKNSDIRGEILSLESSYIEACEAQNLTSELRPLFGEFVAGTCLITEMLKLDGLITLQARGDGPVSILMSEANNLGHFRGVVEADSHDVVNTDNQKLKPISELVGKGVLAITLDPTAGKRYQGVVPLDGANLAECLSHYFEQSEQIPTFFLLFANEKQCGGMLLQCLPPQEITDPAEREEQWQTIIQLASTLKQEEFLETDHDTLLYRLFHELECETFEARELKFKCSCSRVRSENAISSLGPKEITDIINEGNSLEIGCHLCGKQYEFTIADIQAILDTANTVH